MSADRPSDLGLRATGIAAGEENRLRRAVLGDVLGNQARRQGARDAVVFHRSDGSCTRLSYAELDRRAVAVARRLAALGLRRGDVLAGFLPNGDAVVAALYGALKLGVAYTGVNPAYTRGELHHQLTHSRARAVVVPAALRDRVADAVAASASPPMIVDAEALTGDAARAADAAADAADDDGAGSDGGGDREPYVHETDVALVIYTSGTESRPKGVLLSHRNFLVATSPAWSFDGYLRRHDRFLLLAPMFTAAGLGTVLNCINVGATIVLVEAAEPGLVVRVIAEERVTNMSQTPAFYHRLLGHPDLPTADLSSLEQCHTYGGLSAHAVFAGISTVAPHMTWATYWGQSELSQLGSIGFFRDAASIPGADARWIGSPVAHLDCRVVDPSDRDAEVGELIVRSPGVMIGYLDDEERTAATLRGGWLRTGDLVRTDGAGNLFFFDRIKDVIKTGGMNVASLEVEQAILQYPDVIEVAVVGLPDDRWSEAVTAFVVAAPGRPLDVEGLLRHCRGKLVGYKIPKRVVLVDALPRDAQGKLLKRALRRA